MQLQSNQYSKNIFEFSLQVIKMEELMGNQLVQHLDHRLTRIQVGLMRTIYEHQPLSMTELSDLVFMNYGNTSTQCKKLEAAGYLMRERNKEDERYVDLYLTDQGEKVILTLNDWLDKFQNDVSQEFPPEEWDKMRDHLIELRKLVDASISVLERNEINE